MTPPKLSWNAPVSQSANPSVPSLLFFSRNNFEFLIFHSFDHRSGNLWAVYIPLRLNHRLDHILRPLACSQSHFMILLILPWAYFFQLFLNDSSAFESFHSSKLSAVFVDVPIFCENVNELKLMSLTTGIIVRIMSRCNFDSSCSKVHFHKIVSNYNNFTFWDQGVNQLFSYQVFISLIIWMNSYSHIT